MTSGVQTILCYVNVMDAIFFCQIYLVVESRFNQQLPIFLILSTCRKMLLPMPLYILTSFQILSCSDFSRCIALSTHLDIYYV